MSVIPSEARDLLSRSSTRPGQVPRFARDDHAPFSRRALGILRRHAVSPPDVPRQPITHIGAQPGRQDRQPEAHRPVGLAAHDPRAATSDPDRAEHRPAHASRYRCSPPTSRRPCPRARTRAGRAAREVAFRPRAPGWRPRPERARPKPKLAIPGLERRDPLERGRANRLGGRADRPRQRLGQSKARALRYRQNECGPAQDYMVRVHGLMAACPAMSEHQPRGQPADSHDRLHPRRHGEPVGSVGLVRDGDRLCQGVRLAVQAECRGERVGCQTGGDVGR